MSHRSPSLRTSLLIVIVSAMLFVFFDACVNPAGPIAVTFFKTLGAGDNHFGLMTGIGQIMMVMLFVGAIITNSVARRKPWFMLIFIVSRVLYLPIAFGPLIFPDIHIDTMMLIVIVLLGISHGLTQIGSMMWQSWMADLVPHRVLNHYWGVRQRAMSFTAIGCSLMLAGVLHRVPWSITITFPLLVAIGVLAGVIDILLFFKVREPQHHIVRNRHVLHLLLEPIRDREYRGFLGFQCAWAISAGIGGAFVWPYSTNILCLSASAMVLLVIAHRLGMGASTPLWGKLADKHGHKPVFIITLCLKPMFLLGFMLCTSAESAYFILPPIFLLDGILNGGLFLAKNGYAMKQSPRENRPMFIAAATGLCGICGGLAIAGVGIVLKQFEDWSTVVHGFVVTRYHVLFTVSMLLRWACIPLTAVVHEPTSSHPKRLLEDIWATRRLFRWDNRDDERID